MNASEARKTRTGPTLVERIRKDQRRSANIDFLVNLASLEHIIQKLMTIENVSPSELARRMKAKPPQVSRDLHGGLQRATVARVAKVAEALGYEFIPMFIRQNDSETRKTLEEAAQKVLAQ